MGLPLRWSSCCADEPEVMRHHDSSARARRSAVVVVLCSALVAIAGACTEPEAMPFDNAASPQPPVSVTPAPRGTEADGLVGLPVAQSTARLVIGTRLLDLGRGTSVDLEGIPSTRFAAFTSAGDVVYPVGPRTFEVLNASTGERHPVQVPGEIIGSIGMMELIDDRIAIVVVSGNDEARIVVVTLDGEVQCEGPPNTGFFQLEPGLLWSYPSNARLDLATCAVSEPLDVAEFSSVDPILVNDDVLYATVGSQNSVGVIDDSTIDRFDLATGRSVATSVRLGSYVSDAVLQAGELWVLADSRLVRLGAETLEVVAKDDLAPDVVDCGNPRFVRQAGDLYVIEDCSLVLYLLDSDTGRAKRGWRFPSDELSDSEIIAVPSDEGIWMVDVEQTGVPYLFDAREQRFERLPITAAQAADIYAFDFQVYPGPGD